MVYVLIWPLARLRARAKARTNTPWYICTVYDVVGYSTADLHITDRFLTLELVKEIPLGRSAHLCAQRYRVSYCICPLTWMPFHAPI
jgi:hypothetical protein